MVFLIALGGLIVLWLVLEWRQQRKRKGRLTIRRDNVPEHPYVGELDNPNAQLGNVGS